MLIQINTNMFGLIKKMFMRLLISIANASNLTKCLSLSNQKCMIQPTLINLNPNGYSQEFHYYPFMAKVAILLMTYLIKYVFQRKQKI